MKKKTILIFSIIIILILAFAFQDSLIRTYVSGCHEELERYALQLLNNNDNIVDTYGVWKTKGYPKDGMVEFHTGGWGLTPNSTYKGFYYSADDTHKLFSAAYDDNTSMEIDGDKASWTDGTDNNGISIRIAKNWFWFEASF